MHAAMAACPRDLIHSVLESPSLEHHFFLLSYHVSTPYAGHFLRFLLHDDERQIYTYTRSTRERRVDKRGSKAATRGGGRGLTGASIHGHGEPLAQLYMAHAQRAWSRYACATTYPMQDHTSCEQAAQGTTSRARLACAAPVGRRPQCPQNTPWAPPCGSAHILGSWPASCTRRDAPQTRGTIDEREAPSARVGATLARRSGELVTLVTPTGCSG